MSDSQTGSDQQHDQSPKELDRNTQLFLSLVTSMHMGAMYQLGKVASPISGKIERDLNQAQYTIDLLSMLEDRTKGNLVGDEGEYLTRVLSELRMNYVDESSKPDPVDSTETETASESPGDQDDSSGADSDK